MFILTPQISTGDVTTVLDTRDTTKSNNNAQIPLGTSFWDPSLPQNKYRYVRYLSAAGAAVQAFPANVWWTDNTYTTVTGTVSESMSRSAGAGIMLLNTGQSKGPFNGKTGAAAALLLAGNFIIIQVAGHIAGVGVAASTAVGDYGLATQSDWTTTAGFSRIAKGAAMTDRVVFFAETAVNANVSDVFAVYESA